MCYHYPEEPLGAGDFANRDIRTHSPSPAQVGRHRSRQGHNRQQGI